MLHFALKNMAIKRVQILLVVLSIVYIVDEVTSAMGTSMQSEVVTEFFVKARGMEFNTGLAAFTAMSAPLYSMMILMLTDVLLEGTQIIYVGDDETIQQAFNVTPKDNTVFLPKIMSRKKQIVPSLSALWG